MQGLPGFSEEDKQKVVDFLNIVAKHAEFKFKTNEVIEYFKLLAYMQQTILPKIDNHILEVKRLVEPEEKKPKKSKK